MPVPTPPNKDLFKVTPPKEAKKDTKVQATSVPLVKESVKKPRFVPQEHLTQSPFKGNQALLKLQYDLKKETDPKKPIKRSPRRKPATKKTTGDK